MAAVYIAAWPPQVLQIGKKRRKQREKGRGVVANDSDMSNHVLMTVVPTIRERQYEVKSEQVCVVSSPDGALICVAEPKVPVFFTAESASVMLSDASATVTLTPPISRRNQLHRKRCTSNQLLLPKYESCEQVSDMVSVQTEYVTDVDSGVWRYSLKELVNGDGLFTSVVSLRDFLAELPGLQSGKNMFYGCALSLCSVNIIARTVPAVEQGVLTLGIDIRCKKSSVLSEALMLIESKGWTLEVQYNAPPGVPTLAELEYIESDGTSNILIPLYEIASGQTFSQSVDIQFFSQKRTLVGFLGTTALYWGNTADGVFELGGGVIADNIPFARSKVKYTTTRNANIWLASLTDGDWAITRTGHPSTLPSQWEYGLFTLGTGQGYSGLVRIWSCSISFGALEYDLIPVLDECGEACMFDKISRKYFYREGPGQFTWELKTAVMIWRNRAVATPVELPRSPIWARVRDNQMEWCHYTSDTSGWQMFASVTEAQEILGINTPE